MQERGRNHEWCATFRIAKDQHVGLLHRETDPSRFSTMINMSKEGQIATVYAHNALDRGKCPRHLWIVHVSHLSPVLSKESLSPSLLLSRLIATI